MYRQWVLVVVTVAVSLPTSSNFGSDPNDGAVTTRFNLNDNRHAAPVEIPNGEAPEQEHKHYPNCVNHQPGRPRKPLIQRAGDINVESCPAARYSMGNHQRAGGPDHVAFWARCAVNKNYSAWFVGGGTPWIYSRKALARNHEEGTWGMDYDGLFRPRRVWMKWGCDREQGGLGAYETDGKPAVLRKIWSL